MLTAHIPNASQKIGFATKNQKKHKLSVSDKNIMEVACSIPFNAFLMNMLNI
jgi:hypothetical protein